MHKKAVLRSFIYLLSEASLRLYFVLRRKDKDLFYFVMYLVWLQQ